MSETPDSKLRAMRRHELVAHIECAEFQGIAGALRNMMEWDEIKRRLLESELEEEWAAIPQALYNSKINFSISGAFDGGWIVRLGDDDNVWDVEVRVPPPLKYEDALQRLKLLAIGYYPEILRNDFAEAQHRRIICTAGGRS